MSHHRQLFIFYSFIIVFVSVSSNNLFWWLKDDPRLVGLALKGSTEDSFEFLNEDNKHYDVRNNESGFVDVQTTTTKSQTESTRLEERILSTSKSSNDQRPCVCVEYYLCDSNNTIIDNGDGGLIDVRLNFGDTCPGVQVCCLVPDSVTPRTATPRIPTELTPRESITEVPPMVCGERGGFASRLLNDDGDNSTEFAEFPWMLALLKTGKLSDGRIEDNIFHCGASLIHPQVALTAAHCVTGRKEGDLKIRAGDWDAQSNLEPVPHQERSITRIIKHSDFYSGALYNDIALLVLDKPLKIVVNVQPICLPQQDAVFNGRRCLATGWGLDGFGKSGEYQTTLKKVELPIVPHDTCQSKLRESRLGSQFRLHQSFVCGGGEPNRDTCKGDGGGPLVCYDAKKGGYVQVGIVSWGLGCGDGGVPAVYTNVPKFRKWLDDNLQQLGFN